MKKIFYQLLFIYFCFNGLFLTNIHASEKITQYDAKIDINKNGTITVEEKIDYDFGLQSKHGIYRIIPFVKTNQENKKYRLDIADITVTDEKGAEYRFTQTYNGEDLTLKIGDASTYVTGQKVYKIKYQVSGALTYFSDHDELNWNVIGNAWEVPIASVTAEVQLPQGVSLDNLKSTCYTGVYESKTQSCVIQNQTEGVITAATQESLYSKEGLTIVVGFPKGIAAVLEPKEVISFWSTFLGKLLSLIIALAALFWYVIYPIWLAIKWYRQGRDPESKLGQVTAWYDPPKTASGRLLTPVETGTLIDEQVDLKDISGMIVDLARRGYYKIVEKKKNDFYFIQGKDFTNAKDILPFEKEFLQAVITDKEIRIKDLILGPKIEKISAKVYEQQVGDGFFPSNPNSIRNFYLAITGLAAFTFNFQLVFSALVFGRSMPKKTLLGVEQKNVALSLKKFLQSQERQLEFQAKNQLMFEKLLPYAIVFGVEKIWADRFKDINLKQPSWYSGYDNRQFNSLLFISSLNSSFSSIRSTMTSTNSSSGFSSGFSSGGFSGGGGGGGGGGSW